MWGGMQDAGVEYPRYMGGMQVAGAGHPRYMGGCEMQEQDTRAIWVGALPQK